MYKNNFVNWDFELVDFMEDLVRVFDKTGLIVYTNTSMKKFLENEEGKFCFFSDDDTHKNDKKYSSLKCVAPIGHKERVETELLSVGERDFLVKSSPIFDDNKEYWGCIEVFRDITEENRLQKDLLKYQQMIENDMLTASDIQKSLLSKLNRIDGLNIEYKYISSDQLSGDFFDVIELPNDKTCVYMADVMGHGISASMITMFIKFSVRMLIHGRKIEHPREILMALSKEFSKLNLEMYFTIFLGIYNRATCEFEYSNAGHNSIPLLFCEEKNVRLELSGLPISWLFQDSRYSVGKVKLCHGDCVLFYTDGITETKNKNREEYGEERFFNVVEKYKNSLSDKELLDKLVEDVSEFRCGVQEDDIALLSLRVL